MNNITLDQASGAEVGNDVMPLQDLQPAQAQFTLVDGAVLLKGSKGAGTVYFPERSFSMDGGARDLEPALIGPHGQLYSFSTVHVSASRSTPYTIGYVDFPCGVRVLCEVRGDAAQLRCDCSVTLRHEGDSWFVEQASPMKEAP